MNELIVSTPGRICLFGEHQDYLNLPVIPCAITLRLTIEGRRQHESRFDIDLSDTGSRESSPLQGPLPYVAERDYFRSVLNVLLRHGFSFSQGFRLQVRSAIPISAGTSSSSALVVGWTNFLAQISDQCIALPEEELARYAYEAEVLEFGEPGGMMDQYTAAYGGILAIEFYPELRVERLPSRLGPLVLGDSGQPKDTKSVLARVKNSVLAVLDKVSMLQKDVSLQTATLEGLESVRWKLEKSEFQLLRGILRNRDITREARNILVTRTDPIRLGELFNEHQGILRDVLKVSTPKLDRMIDAALAAGASGAKINGSGGGGCMFAYADENAEDVAEAVQRQGGKATIVTIDSGSHVESRKLKSKRKIVWAK